MSLGNSDFLKNTFCNVVKDYEYARPGYPAELYQNIRAFAGLGENAQLLEVGAGTGQATELFLDCAEQLDLVEVSEEQVRFLEKKYKDYPQVSVNKAYFEEYITEQKYDLIYSATAFHWVKSDIGYPKAWELLKEGGTLAVFWHMSSVTFYDEGIFRGLNQIKKKYLPEESLGFDEDGIQQVISKRVQQIQSGGCFGEPEILKYRWVDNYDAERYVALINTYSSTQSLEAGVRQQYLQEIREFIQENGGEVKMPQLVILYLVKKEKSHGKTY